MTGSITTTPPVIELPPGSSPSSIAKGDPGATGPANTLAIGTVTNGGAASATITGTAPAQTLNLVLPQGPTGATGATGATGPSGSVSNLADGAVGTPSLAWQNNTTSGLYRIASDRFGYAFTGVLKYEMNATDFILPGNPTVALGAAPKQYADLKLAIASNLSDLNNATTALTNLGGTTVGKAVFIAANAAAGQSALSLTPDTNIPSQTSFNADVARLSTVSQLFFA